MKQRVFAFTFIVLYMIAMIRPIVPVVDYIVRYDYYAEVLCINKDKPEMQCNGTCHLAKQVVETVPIQSNDEQPPMPVLNLDDFPVTYLLKANFKITALQYIQESNFKLFLNTLYSSYLHSVFRPPRF